MKIPKFFILFISIILFSIQLKSQNMSEYNKLWKSVEKYEYESLPKSALETVDKIMLKSLAEKEVQQTIKAVLYKTRLTNITIEKGIDSSMTYIEQLAKDSEGEQKALLHFVMARFYWQLYQNDRWQILGRTSLASSPDDFNTWTVDDFAKKIHREYELCFEESEILKKIPLEDYGLLKTNAAMPADFMPTVYDFLVYEAIKFYSNSQMQLNKPKDEFSLNNEVYFTSAEDFVNHKITTSDSASFLYHVVLLYQDILRFRLTDKTNENALLYFDLLRIAKIKNKTKLENANKLYEKALNELINKYPDNNFVALAHFKKAEILLGQGNSYFEFNPALANYKKYFLKTDSLCDFIIEKFPKTQGSDKAMALKDRLRFKLLTFNLEQIVSPKSNFPIKINYRNLEKTYIRVASIKQSEIDALQNKYYSDILYEKILKAAVKVAEFEVKLPIDKDFRPHSVEFILDSLTIGKYVIFVSDNANFEYKKALSSYQFLKVSNLSYLVQPINRNKVQISVLDRHLGSGIEAVNVNAFSREYEYRKSKYKTVDLGRFETDKNGQVIFEYNKEQYTNVHFDFNKKGDKLSTHRNYYVNAAAKPSNWNIKTHLFTDRAMYRPGQIVYFKGIMIKSNGQINEIIADNSSFATLIDFNGQEHGELKVKSNEYGTFSGQFVLPQGQLNGRYNIETDYGSVSFSVEEYKRPKFEVEILPFTKNYTLDQEVSVSGKAMAYSGAAISEAKAVYRITRQPMWSGWWWWNLPDAQTEIANGEIETKDDGTFELKFMALPDPNMATSEFLSFNYKITVDVTDLTGETRSISKSIRVGYRALALDIDIPEGIDLDG
ncbi:MAG: hypothetical protein KAI79_17845, partial [Bacteroidales bacterium]|nr:hypothetical protein [Bacteroidales bacterium]